MINRRIISLIIIISFIFTLSNHPAKPIEASTKPSLIKAQNVLQSQSGFFTENKGQWDPSILFVGDSSFGKVAFAKDAVYYQMIKAEESNHGEITIGSKKNSDVNYRSQNIKLTFVNSTLPIIKGVGLLSHYNNYFIGNDPSKWASYCRNYVKVTYQDVWNGIDLAYFFTPEGLKYEYYVKPYANVKDLQIRVEGAELSNQGTSLLITTELGNIQDANLKVLDQSTGATIPSNFMIQNTTITFQGIPEKRENTIVIDPLVFSTFYGGSIYDEGYCLALDATGNTYISGGTQSSDLPVTPGVYQKTLPGGYFDSFIAKFNPTGTTLIYSTFIGGTSYDVVKAIALDSEDNVYVFGDTNSIDYPTTNGVLQPKLKVGKGDDSVGDAFLTKFNPTGSNLLFSTYYGGSADDSATGISLDRLGNIFVTGSTKSSDFPATQGVFQPKFGGEEDIYIFKFNPTASSLIFSTYLGGSTEDGAPSITLDADGNIFITGVTGSEDFPITKGAIQTKFNGEWDSFVTKINSSATVIIFSTYLGGSGSDFSNNRVVLDKTGNIYITGATGSPNFPVTKDAFQLKNNGELDIYITKMNATGTKVLYSTLLGGTNYDRTSGGIVLDSAGNIYVVGFTNSSKFPITTNAFQKNRKGEYDTFISKINPNTSTHIYSTFLGGSGKDFPYEIILDKSDAVLIVGTTDSIDFPITKDAFQKTIISKDIGSTSSDAFILKFDLTDKITPPDSTPPIIEIDSPVQNLETIDSKIEIKGKVIDKESGIKSLKINSNVTNVNPTEGAFTYELNLLNGMNSILVVAKNGVDLKSTKVIMIKNYKLPLCSNKFKNPHKIFSIPVKVFLRKKRSMGSDNLICGGYQLWQSSVYEEFYLLPDYQRRGN